jgi:hypothetical protein
MRSNRHVPLIVGIASVLLAAYLAISIGGLFGITGATVLLAFGVASVKTAFRASDAEIQELTDPNRRLSEDTARKLQDRI